MTNKSEQPRIFGVYSLSILTHPVILSMNEIGQNLERNLEQTITKKYSGKCIAEGFIKIGSIKIINYSSGMLSNGYITFQVVFECMLCHPVEGMLIECDTKTITKAGIHAEVYDADGNMPITVFIARDHHYTNKEFTNVIENTKITVNVIGIRYELNDPYICVIARLIERKDKPSFNNKIADKPPITIHK
jgi:DNA-directed RNA polymerase subunit E'/Rpb7